MAIVDATRDLEKQVADRRPIGWDGATLREMLTESERLFADTGRFRGIEDLTLMAEDPIGYEKLFARLRGGLVSARETALNISASPIVRELGELCFALYTPDGDSIALSTGIIVHVHTMSDAIKWMVRQDYETNPGIKPGDIFANNDPSIGDVHNADVQTFVPIFWEGELIAWAGGVTHVLDIGASTPGGVPVGPTHRLDDGFDLPCMKIGENDELARWHLERCEKQTRAPMYYLLDEKTRLAGCHMIRDAVERVVSEEGIDRFKLFSHEVIEEGRRSFKSRIRQMTVPGRYRSAAFMDIQFADKQQLPARARKDFVMHAPWEVSIGGSGDYALSLDGASSWGWHSMNCTPSGMQGAIWVMFTQTLICDDKVNDGAYYAVKTDFPENTIANMGANEGSTGIAWAFLQPAFTGYPRTLSRALQSRGFIEEVIGAYSVSGNVIQGGGIDQYGNSSAIMNFEIAAQGMGAKYVLDGTDTAAAMFNPEGDAGDVEMWELITPMIYLSRRLKANTAGYGRHRGGSSFESLQMVWNTPFWELQNLGCSRMFTSAGLFGGYPGCAGYVHNIRGADLIERAERGEAYPVTDGRFDDPALMAIEGEREFRADDFTTLQPFEQGDLYMSVMKGAGGLGDPLLRPAEAVKRDVDEGHLLPEYAEKVYAVSDRDAAREERLERAGSVQDWWDGQRQRLLDGELIEPVRVAYAESMKLSGRWAAEFRGFWDLPEDFEVAAPTPNVAVHKAPKGKTTPAESAAAWLEASVVDEIEQPTAAGKPMEDETLEAMLDERLDRRTVKDIQSGYKDPGRFDVWVRVLQGRVDWDDPIVLPVGEGLNIVRRSGDGELVIRCDCGHDFCAHDENWKMSAALIVRDDIASLREIYPANAHCDPEWMELREFICPGCARLLETEAVIPGYPVVHEFLPDVEGFYRGWLGRELP
ncbi:MAG: hydantoinase B/oxoprolinase family protein [Solirubrobacterales bacterium]